MTAACPETYPWVGTKYDWEDDDMHPSVVIPAFRIKVSL
jgi:hypothetical protein